MTNFQDTARKLTITATAWKPLAKNTLRGFVSVHVGELALTLHDVAVHQKDGRMWAAPAAKPWLKGGVAITDESGKIQYSPLVEFDSPEVRNAFSAAVLRALEEKFPGAIEMEGAL
jgi:hypothetical protein